MNFPSDSKSKFSLLEAVIIHNHTCCKSNQSLHSANNLHNILLFRQFKNTKVAISSMIDLKLTAIGLEITVCMKAQTTKLACENL